MKCLPRLPERLRCERRSGCVLVTIRPSDMHAITNSKSEPATRLQRVRVVTAADGWKGRAFFLARLLVAIAIARARPLSKRRMGTRGTSELKKSKKRTTTMRFELTRFRRGFTPFAEITDSVSHFLSRSPSYYPSGKRLGSMV